MAYDAPGGGVGRYARPALRAPSASAQLRARELVWGFLGRAYELSTDRIKVSYASVAKRKRHTCVLSAQRETAHTCSRCVGH
eukprot:2977049-Prymnesium_polylepis.1